MENSGQQKITLYSIAKNIYPDWEELEHWFYWPPNLFALISTIFQRTGAYKFCLLDSINKNNLDWNKNNWQKKVEDDHLIWLKFTTDMILGKTKSKFYELKTELLILHYRVILQYWKITDINRLRNISDLKDEDGDVRKFVISLITCFAIADSSCRGLGLVGQTTKKENKINKLFHIIANLLLNNTGSLSTIPKFHGTVLPKMRTPQSGLSLRSLSHHLTFHATEVEIMWRTFPWLNNDKQSLNVLAVPHPSEIDQTNFQTIEDNYHSVRYFKGKVNEVDESILINSLVNEVKKGIENHSEIDIIVLPEMALNEATYNLLLNTFAKYSTDDKGFIHLPIIIAGVVKETEKEIDEIEKRFEPFHNEARIATFFGGKWYYIRQRKHHRWHLNRNQVLQYKLEGYFPTDRNWFELCTISQRRLTVLAPNSWLALSSLICEDLAQQEPIGDVIRGIGPTLLMALLSDGPQLTHRWSARYASVLADDPGTAVLSLTSRGMAARSQKIELSNPLDKDFINEGKSVTVGLWKDMVKGWKELCLPSDKQALLFTISATFKEEFTLDGRSDHSNASVFKMNTISPIPICLNSNENYIQENQYSLGGWDDIRDLSALLFTIDSLIDLLSIYNDDDTDRIDIDRSIEIILHLLNGDFNERFQVKTVFDQIKYNILTSWKYPEKIGIEGVDVTKASLNDMMDCIEELKIFIDTIKKMESKNSLFNFYNKLITECKIRLSDLNKNPDKKRISKITITAFLFNIRTKLTNWKSRRDAHSKEDIDSSQAMNLKELISEILKNNSDSIQPMLKT